MRWLAVAVVACLAGCIQVQMPTTPTEASAAEPVSAPAPPAPSAYAVACQLADQNGTPLTDASCEYKFGTLGARVRVDDMGVAIRNVPAGAKGTVSGSAPGHAAAKADVVADGPKTVRMMLPLLPKGAPERVPARANSTEPEDVAAVSENGTLENATVYYESHRDLLFQQLYAIVPGDPPVAQEYTFTVDPAYQTLELVGDYQNGLAYAADPMLKVYGPDGTVVLEYDAIDAKAVATGTGGGQSFPMGFILAPKPGAYRISIGGAGAPAVEISVFGLVGLAPDFEFLNLTNSDVLHLNEFAGKIVIVDLMASWCGPCNDAMPGLKAIRKEYGGQVEILSVDIDPEGDPSDDLRAFVQRHGVDWPIGYEIADSATKAYGTGWIPTMVLIDQHGGLIYRQIGEIDQDELRDRIDAALAAA